MSSDRGAGVRQLGVKMNKKINMLFYLFSLLITLSMSMHPCTGSLYHNLAHLPVLLLQTF